MILRPPEPISEIITIVQVIDNKTIKLFYSEYKIEFRDIAKNLSFDWYKADRYIDRCQQRSIIYRNGNLEDRLIEICYKLLESGFIIDLPENYSHLVDKILSCEYEQEQTRWIIARTLGDYTGWLAINYNRRIENYYHQARLLPNSRYDKPYVVIKSIYYDQILDFAQLYKFSITQKALEILEQAKAEKLKQIRYLHILI